MPQSLAQKLRLKPGQVLLPLEAPSGFEKSLDPLPEGVKIKSKTASPDQVHCFAENQAGLAKQWARVRPLFRPGMIIWFYYPKGSSGRQTDLTRDKGWDCLKPDLKMLAWLGLYSFDETWSVAGYRVDTAKPAGKKMPAGKETTAWINPVTREVKIPPDLETAFRKYKKEAALFGSLSFTHRKEYVEWIVTAKKAETRARRVEGTIGRLRKNMKNPRNL